MFLLWVPVACVSMPMIINVKTYIRKSHSKYKLNKNYIKINSVFMIIFLNGCRGNQVFFLNNKYQFIDKYLNFQTGTI